MIMSPVESPQTLIPTLCHSNLGSIIKLFLSLSFFFFCLFILLKLNIQKTKVMASGPITSWQIDGETVETVTDIVWAPKSLQMVTAAMIKRRLLLGRKAMTNVDSILKSRDITLLTIKVRLVKAMVFPVVMYGCESWI